MTTSERRAAARRRHSTTTAFTLVELLIVIALSALLLALLFAPIIQGFRLTNRAKALVQAQNATRFGLERMEREISQAAYVFDNSGSPIVIPLEPGGTINRQDNGAPIPVQSTHPLIAFGKIDLIPTEIAVNAGVALDPTTNTPIGGGNVRLPNAPSARRYVRYFIGLFKTFDATGNLLTYQNRNQFPHSGIDKEFNPFVLYRAEYDPNDPNLVAQTPSGPQINTQTLDDGSLKDPDFFYNVDPNHIANTTNRYGVAGNGNTYAANWKAVASAIITGPNLDMILWQRGSNGRIDPAIPFKLGATFAPATVASDTVTPGFLTNAAAEAPGAVPSLYTAKYGAWTVPFSVTVFRGATQNVAGTAGSLTLTFAFPKAGPLICSPSGASGAFAAVTTDNLYWMVSSTTGKFFVSVPGLSFTLDPSRGRVETGLPPIETQAGVPYFYDGNNNGTVSPLASATALATTNQNDGDLVQTIYRSATLDVTNASQQYLTTTSYAPANQGILFADLGASAAAATGTGQLAGYFATTLSSTPMSGLTVSDLTHSPFVDPNDAQKTPGFLGAALVPGSERVTGPNGAINTPATGTIPLLYAYTRVTTLSDNPTKGNVPTLSSPTGQYVRTGPLNYNFPPPGPHGQFSSDPILQFDINNGDYAATNDAYRKFLVDRTPAGLPALPISTAGAATATEVQVSFLWQNNYARNAQGYPVDSSNNTISAANAGQIAPEPDVFKLDYATRSLMNVGLGVEVYDTTTGTPEISQVSDKIKINNGGR